MKTLFTSLFLLVSVIAFGQDPMYADIEKKVVVNSNLPQKGQTKIVLNTDLSGQEAFKAWGKHLAQHGYALENINSDFLTFNTKPKDASKFNVNHIVSSVVSDSGVITVTMQWQIKSNLLVNSRETGFNDWEFVNNKQSNITGVIYNDVMSVVNNFGSPVSFAK